MFQKNKKQVNLIIKDRAIRYMVNNQPTLSGIVDYGEVQLESGIIVDGKVSDLDGFTAALRMLVSNKKWKNRKTSFCVPDASVTIREHFVPKQLKKQEIKSYINMDLEDNLRLPFSNPVIDFVVIGEENEQVKILLFAYPKDRINEYLHAFKQAGLLPTVADLSSLSLHRLYHELGYAEEGEHLLLAQWGRDAAVLTAFNENKPVFTRQVKSILTQDAWEFSPEAEEVTWQGSEAELNESIDAQLTMLERFLDFYQYSVMDGEKQINKLLLCGDFPFLSKVENYLKENYKMSVLIIKELEEEIQVPAKFADVLGLSIKK
ncbi:type IV pilus biogenesis protein PilM [Virgibacillus senegalensis]|uniref:type IV pilus biogenesis protein PilM n=1 Tax=Virgibacillus senegalensis TaxID=1499679 RepID=UPI00069ECFB9|nr:pilus assembly protein PilM [Virgibacillus senegalensis]